MTTSLPQFQSIQPNQLESQLKTLLQRQQQAIEELVNSIAQPTWDNFIAPLDELSAELHTFWAPISHLNNVDNTPELREAYNACLPQLSAFSTWLGHHQRLYTLFNQLKQSDNFAHLDKAQQTIINNELLDFTLAGIALPDDKKSRYAAIAEKLSQLSTTFEENILDTTAQWNHLVSDIHELDGLPDHFIDACAKKANDKNQTGWLLTLDAPSVMMVTQYAQSRALRRTVYDAYCTRASEQPPHNSKHDNTPIINETLALRLELAKLLDFEHFAAHSLATKMIKQPEDVLSFLQTLIEAAMPQAKTEMAALQQFSREHLGLEELDAWDIAYASEQYRLAQYDISQETLRPYFQAPTVVQGLFHIANALFQIDITEITQDVDTWHSDVQCFKVTNDQGQATSYFYLDLYTRDNKRNGAWMDDCQNRWIDHHGNQHLPITFITCNFQPPHGDQPALLTHDDVVTLFHEFGHATQHMLTKINYLGASGLTGIPWDAVEIASQFLENYAWEKGPLMKLSQHIDTGEPLPDDLFQKMLRAKHFQSAMGMMRQLQFALFDFRLHMEFNPQQEHHVQTLLDEVRDITSLAPTPTYNRFQHSFSHIFAGGYAAGYYSYKWAEVMAADIFALFQESDIFNPTMAKRYKDTFLALGGAENPLDVFIQMCGREPELDALLRLSGIEQVKNYSQ